MSGVDSVAEAAIVEVGGLKCFSSLWCRQIEGTPPASPRQIIHFCHFVSENRVVLTFGKIGVGSFGTFVQAR